MGLGGGPPMGGPPMGGPGPGMGPESQGQQTQNAPMKVIKTIDVWSALEKSLANSKKKSGQEAGD